MITLVEGNIGSGKTYFVVHQILNRYYKFCETEIRWIPRPDMEFTLYSNVDGFHIAKDLDEAIRKAGGVSKFFNAEYQQEFARLNKHIYVIDEVQKPEFFHRKFYDPKVFYFFQYHRHFGVDIYLITQDVYSVARELQTLPEYRINAVRRSYAYAKEFRYHYMCGKDIFRRRTLRIDLKVFSAYRSSTVDSSHNVSFFSRKYYIYIGLFVFLAVVGFTFMLKYRFSPPAKIDTVHEKSSGQYKIVALYSDNALVKNLLNKKIQRVPYSNLSGDLHIGAIVSVKM